ncbi:group 3 RNA polymerase sigma-70 subunit SigG [Thermosynechococcus sp. NK55a]|jgi:RNA polymerase sigma-70 factor (ECF subfamily)|uniref:sigma-70 family RNA polymerase sigma factor n=1 Tax=unclassified Thermosynechococcus TaxID=2622553 RepID=UPI0003D88312|nr:MULTISPECIES: sigma-70 family RNA polymerase sigma factor [unclassified Thermosynechococcus]AHB88736.1 group 3 RNA polymerase sigma-70 subunit SigG [Thermosynechococcus sp. NK55a]RMH65196.1 MAG: sigma-70 family RNA polymerase sigma factor [Cyanobacteria bacterium J003]HIK23960.1 sigma-70 family RNA polymerase sigma factor [Thermosynechococcus sp. M3746_W2019_013]
MTSSLPLAWTRGEETSARVTVPLTKLTAQELVVRCQAGRTPDRAAFTELLRRYQSHVERIIYHLAPDWDDRADLVQEVWIRVYRNIHKLQDTSKFRGWLSRIATNLFYDELRKRKRHQPPLSLDAPLKTQEGEMSWELAASDASPDERLRTDEFYDQLRRAIANLPEAFRTTIVLREIEGLSYEEIAQITGVSLGTVKSRIARARQRLQLELQAHLDLPST